MNIRYVNKFILFLGIIILVFQVEVISQDNVVQDSVRAARLIDYGRELYNRNELDSALDFISRAMTIATDNNLAELNGEANYLTGLIYDSIDNWSLTLRYLLKSSFIFRDLSLPYREAQVNFTIARRYENFGLYDMAAGYYNREFYLYPVEDQVPRLDAALRTSLAWYREKDYDSSYVWYEKSYRLCKIRGDTLHRIESLYGMAGSLQKNGELSRSKDYLNELIKLQTASGDSEGIAEVYNTIALIDFREKRWQGAIDNYSRAANIYEENSIDPSQTWTNIAVCYQNAGDEKLTEYYFEKALDASRKNGNLSVKARSEYMLAVLNYNEDDLYHADFYCDHGLQSAIGSDNWPVARDIYLVYSNVKEAGNDFIKALEYYERYLSIRDSLLLIEQLKQQEKERLRNELNAYEQQLRLSLADEEIRDLAMKNLIVEADKRENEMQLLKSQQKLAVSEKQRLENFLALERERTGRMLQQREIDSLERATMQQRLEIIQRQNQEQELLRKNEALESEALQRQLELEKEKEIRKRAIMTTGLLGMIVIIVVASLISLRRKNQILAAQKKEIEEINSDLESKNREISQQKEIIEEKNQSITDSIEYARRIQNAVLPPENFLTEFGFGNFIFFRPKDIVSGDFYWGARTKDFLCLAAADCTGHGVPGAFMSMLGTAYLNEIINTRKVSDAGQLLNMLRTEVIRSLKQRGVEGEAQDGMDISLIIIDEKNKSLHYAGANNPLYVVRGKEMLRYDADKMPIGIHRSSDKPFTNHIIKPQKGDLFYLFSDGYADQFGGEHGKKFKYSAFREMLLDIHQLPMAEQRSEIMKRFDDWKGNNEQVDDVLVIGLIFE